MSTSEHQLREIESELRDKQEQLRELADREQHYRDLLLEAGDEIRRLREDLSQKQGSPEGGQGEAGEADELRRTVELQRKTIVEMREQLHAQTEGASRHESLQRELDELRRQLEESEQIRARQKKALSVVGQVNTAREEEIERLRGEASSGTVQADQLRKELMESLTRVNSLEGDLESLPKLRQDLESARQQHDDARIARVRLEERIAALVPLEQQSEQLAARVATLAGERDQARAESGELRAKSGALEKKVRELEPLRAELDEVRKDLKGNVDALALSRREHEKSLESLAERQAELGRAGEELTRERDNGKRLDEQKRKLEADLRELQGERDRLKERQAESQRASESAAAELKKTADDLKVAARERDRLAEETRSRAEEIERLGKELEKSAAATGRVEESLAELGAELERVQAARERDGGMREQLLAEISELKEVERKYQKLAPAREALQRRVEELERGGGGGAAGAAAEHHGPSPDAAEVARVSERLATAEQRLAEQGELLERRSASLRESQGESEDLRGKLAAAIRRADEVERQARNAPEPPDTRRLESELAAALREKTRLGEQLEEARQQHAAGGGREDELRSELERRTSEVEAARAEVTEAKRRGSERDKEAETLRGELERIRMKLDRAEARLESQQVARGSARPNVADDLPPGDRFVRELRADLGEEEK